MRLRLCSLLWFLSLTATAPGLAGAAAGAAAPNFEFRGVSVAGAQTMVSLSLPDGSAKWVEVGREFFGYRVERYEPAKPRVVLTKDGIVTELPLLDASVQSIATVPPSDPTRETRLALWEKIKNLEGDELIKELLANPVYLEPQTRDAFHFLFLSARNFSEQVNLAKQSLERGAANADGSEHSKLELEALTKSLAGKSQIQKSMNERLGLLAAVAKKAFAQSLAAP